MKRIIIINLTIDGALILPSEYLTTKNWRNGEITVTKNTIAIHHSEASWYTSEMKKIQQQRFLKEWISHLPSKIGEKILGKKLYQAIRHRIKG